MAQHWLFVNNNFHYLFHLNGKQSSDQVGCGFFEIPIKISLAIQGVSQQQIPYKYSRALDDCK